MKAKKILGILLCSILVLSSMTGCGKKSDAAILATSLITANSVKNVEADMTLTGTMTVSSEAMGDQTEQLTMNSNTVVFTEPMKAKVTATTNVVGTESTTESYIQQDGDDYILYTQYETDDGKTEWMKTTLAGADQAMQQMGLDTMKQLGTDSSKYTKLEEKTENERMYHVYQYTIESEELKGMLEQYMGSANLSSLTNGDADLESIYKKIFESIGTITMKVWIDTEDETVYKIELPMTDLMNGMFNSLFGDDSSKEEKEDEKDSDSLDLSKMLSDVKISVSDMNMVVVYKNYGSATDFEIPEDALKAEEMSSLDDILEDEEKK